MFHLTEDELYCLAEITEEMQVYNMRELEQMEHLKTCEICYKKFCFALALSEVTSDAGYMALSDIYNVFPYVQEEMSLSERVLAVVQVIRKDVKNSLGVMMEQINQWGTGIQFVPSSVFVNRGYTDDSSAFYKLESIEDEKTFVLCDAQRGELMLQINRNKKIKVYITSNSIGRVEIPLTVKGNLLKGVLLDVPKDDFKIHIEESTK